MIIIIMNNENRICCVCANVRVYACICVYIYIREPSNNLHTCVNKIYGSRYLDTSTYINICSALLGSNEPLPCVVSCAHN